MLPAVLLLPTLPESLPPPPLSLLPPPSLGLPLSTLPSQPVSDAWGTPRQANYSQQNGLSYLSLVPPPSVLA